MGVYGVMQVTLRARGLCSENDSSMNRWSLPAYVASMRSPSLSMSTGGDLVIIHPRIATALNIDDGDEVEFLFNEIGDTFLLKVTIRDGISSDVLIHDLMTLGIAKSVRMDRSGEHITFESGKVFSVPIQEMWAGMKILQRKGSARLYFDGASRNNPKGPCGYGFCIAKGDEVVSPDENDLVQGYVYGGMNRSNNEMEYEGLFEGLIWATRLDLKKLVILGDSELIIKQLTGEYSIRNHRLRALHQKICALLECRTNADLEIRFQHIPREKNLSADRLANQAVATRNTLISCNWPNINQMMARSFHR